MNSQICDYAGPTPFWSNSFAYDGLMRKRIEQEFAWAGSSGWQLTNELHYIYDGNLVLQKRDKNNQPLTTYTRGIDLSETLQGLPHERKRQKWSFKAQANSSELQRLASFQSLTGERGIGGLLARSDNQKIVPAMLTPANPNPQNVVTSYYFNDDQGNVTALVSPAGMLLAQYEYDPFGNLISKSGLMADPNKYRFSSKEWDDNSGLYYYGYRFYDPNLQRWVNRDPLATHLGSVNSQNNDGTITSRQTPGDLLAGPNLYQAMNNRPLRWIDPLGLYDYSAAETQQQFLGPAFASATAGPIQGIKNMYNNSSGAGPYDFAFNEHRNDTFCANGKRMDAAAFGNFIAGYQGRAYDEYVPSPFPALLTMYGAGLWYHNTPNNSTSKHDRLDRSGFPFIHLGAESVPDSPAMLAGIYDSSPIY